MTASLESFKSSLERLIANFESDKAHYLSKHYLEAQARVDFITPFFEALGWDVGNKSGLRHDEREVIVERGESDTTGRPDYSFRVAGETKFFVEAKAPSEPLSIPKHILQAKGYAWNTRQVFFVVLTDFVEFRFYDASIRPDERKPDEGLLLRVAYAGYLSSAEKIWQFSRERVMAGSLDALMPRDRRTQRLRIPVDQAFLDEMTGWRAYLAKGIYKKNPSLTARQLNEVVQRLLDRIVFVRIAEDRRIIEKRQLADAVDEWKARGGKFDLFDWLNDLFQRINEDFNGEIFKPRESDKIRPDSEVLARIIERLYPPKSPYRFDVIGVELLGSIYERYLGKTIRPTGKQVRVEDKPEVRHAGGVYYTPKYIVDYIVKNTVGKIIEGKTPKQIAKLRILDPACGSGSFLIGAFQCLIDYHTRWYLEHPEQEVRHAHPSLDFMREVRTDPDGSKRLSVYRKAKILRNNLFGVDIDPQAVEITMVSLYLKALEGEKSQLPAKQHLLPELKYNIFCGNSLIGPEIYDQGTLFGNKEKERINAFDWQSAFPEIMQAGGFDAVIGNPPYIRVQTLQEWAPFEVEFYKQQYKAASAGNYDIYTVFAEKGLSLLKKEGKLGFILPHKFFNAKYGEPLRSLLAQGKHLSHIVHFGDQQVFEGASNYTCLLFLEKSGCKKFEFVKVDTLDDWRSAGKGKKGSVAASAAGASEWNFAVGKDAALIDRLRAMPVKLEDVTSRIFQGLKTSADKIYIVEEVERQSGRVKVYSRERDSEYWIEPNLLHPLVKGGDSKRYYLARTSRLVLFPYVTDRGVHARLIPEEVMKSQYPLTLAYLLDNKVYLQRREDGTLHVPGWYAFGRSQALDVMPLPKIFTPDIASHASFSLDLFGDAFFTGGVAGGYGILVLPEYTREYVLGLLNSKVLEWCIRQSATQMRGGYYSYEARFIRHLPIRTVDFSSQADKARHNHVVSLVGGMLEMNKDKHSGRHAPSQLDRVEREIARTDASIDESVYELYGISDKERRIIESDLGDATTRKLEAAEAAEP